MTTAQTGAAVRRLIRDLDRKRGEIALLEGVVKGDYKKHALTGARGEIEYAIRKLLLAAG